MHDYCNPGKRQPGEFDFESYVERQFCLIHERLNSEMTDIAGLQADADALAVAIPELATALSTQAASLAQKETDLNAALAQEGLDNEQIAKLQGELAQVEAIKVELDPVATQASGLVSPPAGDGSGAGAEAGDGGGTEVDPGAGSSPADGGAAPAGSGEGGV